MKALLKKACCERRGPSETRVSGLAGSNANALTVGSVLACTVAFVIVAVLLTGTWVYAAMSIETTYLYDLQGTTKDSHFNRQNDVYCDAENNEVYVVDTGNNRIRIFGKEGMEIFQFGQNGVLHSPLDLAINSSGDLLVLQSNMGRRTIDVFDYRGKFVSPFELKDFPEGENCRAQDIAIDSSDNVYLSDQMNGCIYAFDAEGRFRFKILPDMSEKEREEVVFGRMMIDKEDRIFLPISTLGVVYGFDSDGNAVMSFGMQGGGPGKLAFPVDVAVDKHGHFLVLDKLRHCLSVYSREGRYLTEFGGMGTRPGWFYYPSCLEIDRYGRIYISQRFGNKVQVLKVKEDNL